MIYRSQLNSVYWNSAKHQISLQTNNFELGTKFTWKRYFGSKTENVNFTIEFCLFDFAYIPNFSLNWQVWFFGLNLSKMGISGRKPKKRISLLNSAYWISVGTEFQLKLKILSFWIKLTQKGYSRSKAEKVNITIEFFILELGLAPNFTWNKQVLIWYQLCPKRVFMVENGKSQHHHDRFSLTTKFQINLTS